ncbi:class B sortase [Paenibacillus hamazuiensis]|uniref:class B sortase n=1 Tax=Paenibacillus hamazuiensis TaxID=2936508 RepID=UPI002010BCE3|nr:class B sortase [Paenibacillus hamazuiensis]
MLKRTAVPGAYRFFYWSASLLICAGLLLVSIDWYIQHSERTESQQLKAQLTSLYYAEERQAAPPPKEKEEIGEPINGSNPLPAGPTVNERFERLLAMNSEMIGWIHVDGTQVDYPVLQHKDNDYYLNRDATGKKSIYGSIFMDYRLDIDQPQRNLVVYGHNMLDGSMFGSLLQFKNKDFFETYRNITFEIKGKRTDWDIFAVYTVDAREDTIDVSYENNQAFLDALNRYRNKSFFSTEVIPQEDDEILTLVTCSNETDDTRLVMHAVKKRSSAPYLNASAKPDL